MKNSRVKIPVPRIILPANKTHRNKTDYDRSENERVIEKELEEDLCPVNSAD